MSEEDNLTVSINELMEIESREPIFTFENLIIYFIIILFIILIFEFLERLTDRKTSNKYLGYVILLINPIIGIIYFIYIYKI